MPPPLPTVYLVDVAHKKLAWAKLKGIMIGLALKDLKVYNAQIMAMEAVSGFKIGLDELRSPPLKGRVKVDERNPPQGGKLLRAQAWLNLIEAGKFYIVKGKWTDRFIEELKNFPDGDHDDQVDAVSIAYESCNKKKKKIKIV